MRRRVPAGAVLGSLLFVACAGGAKPIDQIPVPTDSSSTSTDAAPPTPNQTIQPAGLAIPMLEPILGYGNFAGVAYEDIDWVVVTQLQAQCANDHGYAVTLIPPGDGLSFAGLPPEQHRMASATLRACAAGLQIPDYETPSDEFISATYDALLIVKQCLEDQGYAIVEPPSLEVFIDTYSEGPWHPYNSVPDVETSEWQRLNEICPQP